MTEIEQLIKDVQSDLATFQATTEDNVLALITTIESLQQAYDELNELATNDTIKNNDLIESQKEEIEILNNFQKGYKVVEDDLNSQIESLKAITELAVKGLEQILNDVIRCNYTSVREVASNTLSEIERLQNE